MRYLYLLFCLHTYIIYAQPSLQNPASRATILVIGLETPQLYSNVYYVDELAYLNSTTVKNIIPLYNRQMDSVLSALSVEKYRFVFVDSAEASLVHQRSNYVDWKNEYGEYYVALDADSVQDRLFQGLMQKHNATYLLTLNYYDIYRSSPPDYFISPLKTRHRIHYELFTHNLTLASAGQIALVSENSKATEMKEEYQEFAGELIQRLTIFEEATSPTDARRRYFALRDRYIKNAWGGGFSLGWGAPYGWFGIELDRYIGQKWDINFGIGYAPSGFKAGLGVRYYLLNYGIKFKPYFGVNYAWASGMELTMGAERDSNGPIVNEHEVTTFKIPSDHAIHLKTGFRWLFGRKALLMGVGYSIPFNGYNAQFVTSGSAVDRNTFIRRERWANSLTVGGPEVSLAYIIYFNR